MKVLLVDGYNVIRSTKLYADISGDDFAGGPGFNAARDALITDVALAAQNEYDATIVFDGGGNVTSMGEVIEIAGIKVMFSRAGQTADSAIEQLARTAREHGDEVVVITSDAQTQWTVMGKNVTRMSSAGFAQEMETLNRSWQEQGLDVAEKNTLANRIDSDVARKLADFVRRPRDSK